MLYHRADALGARRLITEALDVLDGEPPEIRFEPLSIASQIAAWLGDNDAFERWAKLALERARRPAARTRRRSSTHALAIAYLHRLEFAKAGAAGRSASPSSRTRAAARSAAATRSPCAARSRCTACNYAEAEAATTPPRASSTPRSATRCARASMTLMLGRAAVRAGRPRARREAARATPSARSKGLGDRGPLCEAQRALAQVLVGQGRLDEAERFALEARETVGPEDRVSVSTTKIALGEVRAAQGRDAEAEALFREALEGLERYGFRASSSWALGTALDVPPLARPRRRGRASTKRGAPSSARAAPRRSPESTPRRATR